MDLRSNLERRIDSLRKTGNKFKVSRERLILLAADNSPKGANEIRYNYYNEFKDEVLRLVDMKILSPIGRQREDILSYTDYWILPKGYEDYDETLYNHTLNSYVYFNMSYYRLKYSEFVTDKPVIDTIYEYYKQENKEKLTANELGYLLFKDEKAFEQKEESKNLKEDKLFIGFALAILNKLGITLQELGAYTTVEPFFLYTKPSFFEKDVRKIMIIENKDTFYTLAWNDKYSDADMYIYGEGQKINSSFVIADKYGIKETDEIVYFGDLDPIGFSIYITFKKKFTKYNIVLCTPLYEKLVDNYSINQLSGIRKNHDVVNMLAVKDIIIEEFEPAYQGKVLSILEGRKYIPQEGIRFCFS